uniref:Leucine-rich repeat-containing protein 58 n=1 Tax=Philodina roseola TaxID=96448 RepID=B6S346_PHIRO|nr:hypothetical protein [Philodina roseola]
MTRHFFLLRICSLPLARRRRKSSTSTFISIIYERTNERLSSSPHPVVELTLFFSSVTWNQFNIYKKNRFSLLSDRNREKESMATAALTTMDEFDDEQDYDLDDEMRSEEKKKKNNASEILDLTNRNFSENNLDDLLKSISNPQKITSIQLNSSALVSLPQDIERFQSLITVELSNNRLGQLPCELAKLKNLKHLHLKNNFLNDFSLPKEFEQLNQLEVINLGGNRFKQFPYQLFRLTNLKEIYLGSNQIGSLPDFFQNFLNDVIVVFLFLSLLKSGNSLSRWKSYRLLTGIDRLDAFADQLTRLKSLSLHNNHFSALPSDIIRLDLQELSLRNNPLVVRFVRDLTYDVPSLKELAGRTIKLHQLNYNDRMLPKSLVEYLNNAKSCLNPKCQGVYFDTCHKNIKFVDFCGKFYLPLMQFLCSPTCTSTSNASPENSTKSDDMNSKFKKVLLG